ncbi:hypothetical protein DFH06DRAFT_1309129 [Mycena polygramma]|nr:hypothetical protein DFH06DRAFT_1309129 [Mycena polygramma]
MGGYCLAAPLLGPLSRQLVLFNCVAGIKTKNTTPRCDLEFNANTCRLSSSKVLEATTARSGSSWILRHVARIELTPFALACIAPIRSPVLIHTHPWTSPVGCTSRMNSTGALAFP